MYDQLWLPQNISKEHRVTVANDRRFQNFKRVVVRRSIGEPLQYERDSFGIDDDVEQLVVLPIDGNVFEDVIQVPIFQSVEVDVVNGEIEIRPTVATFSQNMSSGGYFLDPELVDES